jgi:outer membrane protein TolC/ABC-type uncharacterized transport system substrate-binding protein
VLVPAALTRAELPAVTFGVVVDGPWRGNADVRQLTIDEITALIAGEFDARFPDEAYLIGDWTLGAASANLDRLLVDPEVDIIITWGLLASHAVCGYESLRKPVIAPVIIDAALQGLPYENGTSGRTNLSYVTFPDDLTDEILIFLDIVPFEHVAILTNAALVDAIPELSERSARSLAGLGVEFDFVPVGVSAEEVLTNISGAVDAVFTWPLFHLPQTEFQRLVDGLNERRLPTFSSMGGADLDAGMFASAGDPEFLPRLTRRVALNAQRILLGEEAGSLPVDFAPRQRLVINMETARAIDVSPRWEVLNEAELLHPEVEEGVRRLSLKGAVEEALVVNLGLAVRRRLLSAGEQDVALARSLLWPQIDLSAIGSQIDDDRAAASFGSQAERTASSSVSLTQLLYSDAAIGNAAVQEYLQQSREYEFESLRLDVALEAATTYLNLMRARALARVQKNNVQQIRSNLDLARVRRELGVASAGEVLRWENELATARRSLVTSISSQRAAEIALNRVLHRPLDEDFLPEDVSLSTPGFPTDQIRFRYFVETPKKFEAFSRFLVIEGLSHAPELLQLDAGIEAQRRLLKSARRAYWAPDLGVQATFEHIFSRSGAGSERGDVFGLSLPVADDTNWSVGVIASLPLFSGGSRSAERIQAKIDLERLLLDRTAVEERLEQRIRSALEQVRASFIGIRFAEESATAARENLALVEDAYARGAASLLDLLDAQTAALNAEEQATNALYDFLEDWLETHRAANILDLILEYDKQMAFADRIDEYFVTRGFPPRRAEPRPIGR